MCESLPWHWDTLTATDKCGNTDGKYPETMLPWLRGGTKLSILHKWTDLPWSHHVPDDYNVTAGQAQLDWSLFHLSLALHRHLDVLAVLWGCHPTWGWGGGSGTPLPKGSAQRWGLGTINHYLWGVWASCLHLLPATNFFQLFKGYLFGRHITAMFAVKTTMPHGN